MNAKPMERRASVFFSFSFFFIFYFALRFAGCCNDRQANIKEQQKFTGGGATTICTQIETGHRQSFFFFPTRTLFLFFFNYPFCLIFQTFKLIAVNSVSSAQCFVAVVKSQRFNPLSIFHWSPSGLVHQFEQKFTINYI